MIHTIFEQQALLTPNSIAVESANNQQRITFRELSILSTRLALHLQHRYKITKTVIGLYMEPCIEMIGAILAILKLGCSYLPLDTDRPCCYTTDIVKDSATTIILTTSKYMVDLAPLSTNTHIVTIDSLGQDWFFSESCDTGLPMITDMSSDELLAYVIYTSGSTGIPHGVMVPHAGVCNLANFNKSLFNLGTGVRILQYASISFDASVFEIFSAILTGSTLVLAKREEILPGEPLANFLRQRRINVLLAPPSSVVMINKDADTLNDLKVLIVGGEKCPSNLAKTWVTSERSLFNAYGPTEATVYATIYRCQLQEEHDSVPIGSVLPGMYIKLLNENGEEVTQGEIGEICIGGTGVALGYLGKLEATTKRFFKDQETGCQVFRTRDLGKELPNGDFEFLGRLDNQIKIRGFRVELEAIENVLNQHNSVENCVVVERDYIVPDQKTLVTFFMPRKGLDVQTAVIQLTRHAKSKLPHYMVPAFFVALDSLPLMPNGSKVDRKALVKYNLTDHLTAQHSQFHNDTERIIADVMSDVLQIPVTPSDNFFQLGGNSLLAAGVMRKIEKKLNKQLPVSLLFTTQSIKAMADIIERNMNGSEENHYDFFEQVDYLREATLDESIVIPDALINNNDDLLKNHRIHALVTGATGFLGGSLVASLLSMNEDTCIHCMVRASTVEEGKLRVINNMKHLQIWDQSFDDRIQVIIGDLCQPLLGLTQESFNFLGRQIDIIYHVAADTSYVKAFSALKAINVFGTHEMLRLSVAGNKVKQFHYVSSMCIYGPAHHFQGKTLITENDDFMESMPYVYTENGYVRSKWVAERMVTTAKERGLPVIVYRPGFIQASSTRGIPNTTDFLCRFIKGCVQIGCYPDMPLKYWLAVPVDYVADSIAHISLNRRNGSDKFIYHLVPKRSQEPGTVQIFEMLEQMGFPLQKVSIKCWHEELEKILDEDRYDNALHPVVMFVLEKVYEGRNTILELHYHTPACTSEKVDAELSGTEITCAPLDENLLKFYLTKYFEQGWMSAPQQQLQSS